jgi:hypothetical protein
MIFDVSDYADTIQRYVFLGLKRAFPMWYYENIRNASPELFPRADYVASQLKTESMTAEERIVNNTVLSKYLLHDKVMYTLNLTAGE